MVSLLGQMVPNAQVHFSGQNLGKFKLCLNSMAETHQQAVATITTTATTAMTNDKTIPYQYYHCFVRLERNK
jgi:hypothetical protein